VSAKSTAAKAAARAEQENRKAITEATLAYEFSPNSYTHSCLSACLAVESALAVLSDVLIEEGRD
jgi:hypothetical protein